MEFATDMLGFFFEYRTQYIRYFHHPKKGLTLPEGQETPAKMKIAPVKQKNILTDIKNGRKELKEDI